MHDALVPFNVDLSEPLDVLEKLCNWLGDATSDSYKSRANMLRVVQVGEI